MLQRKSHNGLKNSWEEKIIFFLFVNKYLHGQSVSYRIFDMNEMWTHFFFTHYSFTVETSVRSWLYFNFKATKIINWRCPVSWQTIRPTNFSCHTKYTTCNGNYLSSSRGKIWRRTNMIGLWYFQSVYSAERRHIWCTRAFYRYIPDMFLLQQPPGSTSAMGLSEWTEPDLRQDRSPRVQ